MSFNKPKWLCPSNVFSFVGLFLFSVYVACRWIDSAGADWVLFALFFMSFGLVLLLLLVCAGAIVYKCISLIFDRSIYNWIVLAWSMILIVLYSAVSYAYIDANIQEEFYEDNKCELWQAAYKIDTLCRGLNLDVVGVSEEDEYGEKYEKSGLSEADFDRIKEIVADIEMIGMYYVDSCCCFDFRYQGLGLYGYDLALHNTKFEQDDCAKIIYNDSVTFFYACGAIGSCCYPCKDE